MPEEYCTDYKTSYCEGEIIIANSWHTSNNHNVEYQYSTMFGTSRTREYGNKFISYDPECTIFNFLNYKYMITRIKIRI